MPRQNIFTGTAANDGTGDTLRLAAEKINETFVELYQHLGADSDQLSPSITFTQDGVQLGGVVSYDTESVDSDGAISLDVPVSIFTSDSDIAVSLANATATGHAKKLINTNAGLVTITPTSFAQGTSFALRQNGACELIWAGASWHLFGGVDSDTTLSITA